MEKKNQNVPNQVKRRSNGFIAATASSSKPISIGLHVKYFYEHSEPIFPDIAVLEAVLL